MGSEKMKTSNSSKCLGAGISHFQVKPSAIRKMPREAAEKLYSGLLSLPKEDRGLLVIVQRFEELSKAFGFRIPKANEKFSPASTPSSVKPAQPTTSNKIVNESEIGRGISNFHLQPEKIFNLDPKSAARLYSGLCAMKLEYQKLSMVIDRFSALSVSFGYAIPEALQVAISSSDVSNFSLSSQLGMLGSRYYSVSANRSPCAPTLLDVVPQSLDDFLDLSDYINIYLHRSDPFISKHFAYPQSFAFLRLLCQRMGPQFEPQMRSDIVENGRIRVLMYMQHLAPIVTIGEGYGDTHEAALQQAAGAVLSSLCFSLVIPFQLLRLCFLSALKYADAVIYACRDRISEFVNVMVADFNVASFLEPVDYRGAPSTCISSLCQHIHRLRQNGLEYWNNRKIFEIPGNIVIPTGAQVSSLQADPFRFIASASKLYDFKPVVYQMPPFIFDFSQVSSYSQFWQSDFDAIVGKRRVSTVPNAEYKHMLLFQNNPITKEMPFDRLVLLPYRDYFDNLSNRLMILPVSNATCNFDITMLATIWKRKLIIDHKALMARFGDGSTEWQHKVVVRLDGIPYIFLGACEHHHIFREAYDAAVRSIVTQLVLMRIIPQELMLLLAHTQPQYKSVWMDTVLHACQTRFLIFEGLIAHDQFSSLAFVKEATIVPEDPQYKVAELFFHTLRCSGHTYWSKFKNIHVPNSEFIPGERIKNGFFEFVCTDVSLDWARNPVHFEEADIEPLVTTKTKEGLRVQSFFEVFNPNDPSIYVAVPEIRKVVVEKVVFSEAAIQKQFQMLNSVPIHVEEKNHKSDHTKREEADPSSFKTPVWNRTFEDRFRSRLGSEYLVSYNNVKSVDLTATTELVRAISYMMKCQIITKLACEDGASGKRSFSCTMRFTAPYEWILKSSYTSSKQEEIVSAAAWSLYREFVQIGCVPPDLPVFVHGSKDRLYYVLKAMRPLIFNFSTRLAAVKPEEKGNIVDVVKGIKDQMIGEWRAVEILLPAKLLPSNSVLSKCPSIRSKLMTKDEEATAKNESTEVFYVPFINERGRPIDDLTKSTPGVKINQGLLKRKSFDKPVVPAKKPMVTNSTSANKVNPQNKKESPKNLNVSKDEGDESDEYLD